MLKLWRETGLSVILLPSGEQGQSLFEIAKLWAELRLISPAIWVRAEDLELGKTGPPKVKATVLGNNKKGEPALIEIELFNQLARESLGLVRLVVLRSVVPEADFDQRQDDLADLLSQYLDWSLPKSQADTGPGIVKPELVKLNLLTVPTEHSIENPSRMINPKFNANFLAAAEDRATPLSGDAFVRWEKDSSKFHGFTMMHLCTLAGIWSGLPIGTYELVRPEVWMGNRLYVSRVFLGAVLTDGLARRASTRVLNQATNHSAGITDISGITVDGTVPIEQEADAGESRVDWLVEKTFDLDNRILQYDRLISEDRVKPKSISAWQQIVNFVKFSTGKLLAVPLFAAKWVWRLVALTLNAVFQKGDQGIEQVTAPEEFFDKRDELVIREIDEIRKTKVKADAALVSPVIPSKVRSTPDLWTNLRQLIFGMLDGSNLEKFGVQKTESGWPIFYKVSSLFKDPAQKLQLPDPEAFGEKQIELNWNDIKKTEELSMAYGAKSAEWASEKSTTLETLVELSLQENKLTEKIEALEIYIREINEQVIEAEIGQGPENAA